MPFHVVLRCDGRPEIGVGHVIRCLALADELLLRRADVTMVGDVVGVPWVQEQLVVRGLTPLAPPDGAEGLATLARELGADAVVLDGYHLDLSTGATLRRSGLTVLAIVDGPFGAAQTADLYLDQNLGAVAATGRGVPEDAVQLLDLDHVLFRDQILEHRRADELVQSDPPRVLALFGGTDANGAAPVVVPLLIDTGRPLHVLAVAARPEIADALAAVRIGERQRIEILSPTPAIAEIAATCDLALTAAGTTVWELLCLGVPAAIVCVTDNQRMGYDAVVARDVALPVGHLDQLRADPSARRGAVTALGQALDDP
ncbi:MAG: hypothetical protein ABI112_13130, partial [Terracoccus sp.]